MKKLLITSIIITLVFAACKKYEDGPFLSFRNREARVANIWVYDKVIKNGEDVTKIYTAGGNKVRYYFSGMGDITITLNVLPSPIENSGQWYLADKDETIVFNLSGFQKTTRWKILRLKENELWYRVVENDPIFPDNETDVFECHLRPE